MELGHAPDDCEQEVLAFSLWYFQRGYSIELNSTHCGAGCRMLAASSFYASFPKRPHFSSIQLSFRRMSKAPGKTAAICHGSGYTMEISRYRCSSPKTLCL